MIVWRFWPQKINTHVRAGPESGNVPLEKKALPCFNPSSCLGSRVDFLVPNISEVAGYSICSSPKLLQETSEIELAVKFSEFPPTKWIHEKVEALISLLSSLCIVGRGWRIGWVDAFHPKGHGFDSRSSRHVGTLGKLPAALRRETLTQFPCCVGSASE